MTDPSLQSNLTVDGIWDDVYENWMDTPTGLNGKPVNRQASPSALECLHRNGELDRCSCMAIGRTSACKAAFLLFEFSRSSSLPPLITSQTECAVSDPDFGSPGFMTAGCQMVGEIGDLSSPATPRWVKYSRAIFSTGEKSISSTSNNFATESSSDMNGRDFRVATMKETNQSPMESG